jgi:hypothetical protein
MVDYYDIDVEKDVNGTKIVQMVSALYGLTDTEPPSSKRTTRLQRGLAKKRTPRQESPLWKGIVRQNDEIIAAHGGWPIK